MTSEGHHLRLGYWLGHLPNLRLRNHSEGIDKLQEIMGSSVRDAMTVLQLRVEVGISNLKLNSHDPGGLFILSISFQYLYVSSALFYFF